MLKSMVSSALAVAVALGAASAAQAQTTAEPFIGPSVGYHTIDADDGDVDVPSVDGAIIGVVGGVDMPLGGGNGFIGVEGNYHFGTGDIDREYGAAVRLGTKLSPTSKLYLKGGYQEVNFDVGNWIGDTELDDETLVSDDTDGGWLVGLGGDFDMSPNTALRLNADTIEFDSARVTAGLAFKF